MLTDGRTDGRTHGRTDARTDGRTDDGRKVITIAHPEQSSGELKKKWEHFVWPTIYIVCIGETSSFSYNYEVRFGISIFIPTPFL